MYICICMFIPFNYFLFCYIKQHILFMHSPLIGIWVILLIYLFLLLALTFHNMGLKCMGPLIHRFFSRVNTTILQDLRLLENISTMLCPSGRVWGFQLVHIVVNTYHCLSFVIAHWVWSFISLWFGFASPPLQYSCLANPMDEGAWWAAVHGVARSQTRLSDFTFTFHFHALEKEMATHSSVLAWRIPGTGEPGGLPSLGLHRVRHNWSDLAAAAALAVKFFRHLGNLSWNWNGSWDWESQPFTLQTRCQGLWGSQVQTRLLSKFTLWLSDSPQPPIWLLGCCTSSFCGNKSVWEIWKIT